MRGYTRTRTDTYAHTGLFPKPFNADQSAHLLGKGNHLPNTQLS